MTGKATTKKKVLTNIHLYEDEIEAERIKKENLGVIVKPRRKVLVRSFHPRKGWIETEEYVE